MKIHVSAAKLAALAGAAAVGGFVYLIAPGSIRKSRERPFRTATSPTADCTSAINPCRKTRWPRSSEQRPTATA